MPSLLTGTTMISTCSTFQSCRLNISDDLQRQGKCSDSCTRLVNPYWYLQLLQMTNQDLLYFWLSLRNVTLPHKTSKYHLLCKKKKKEKKKEKRKLSLMAIWVLILEKKLSAHCKYKNYTKQWVSYSENMCRVLGYDVLDHVYLMY